MAGRKSKYDTHVKPHLNDITKWLKEGQTQAIICKKLGIHQATFCEYKKEKHELNEAIKNGEQSLNNKVFDSLAKRAVGYEYEETKTIIEILPSGQKKQKIEKNKKHLAPDVGAIALYLKNKRILDSLDEAVKKKQIKLIEAQINKLKAETKQEGNQGTTTIIMSNVDEMQAYLDKKAGGNDERNDS
ncbi:hypothetical protein ACXA0J_000330 [Listeria monocytogenes]